eukprot:5405101-Lingulodinium_polyedra.AAC.1
MGCHSASKTGADIKQRNDPSCNADPCANGCGDPRNPVVEPARWIELQSGIWANAALWENLRKLRRAREDDPHR